MLDALLAVLLAYLGLTYLFGMYLAIRALMGRRLRHVITGAPPRRVVRPIVAAPTEPEPSPPAPSEALPIPQRKAA